MPCRQPAHFYPPHLSPSLAGTCHVRFTCLRVDHRRFQRHRPRDCAGIRQTRVPLLLTARREDRLHGLADQLRSAVRVEVLPADLADPAATEALATQIQRNGWTVGTLVNNAGYGVPGRYLHNDWATHARFLQVMVTAVCELTWRLLPMIRASGQGRILNVASFAALSPSADRQTLYAASKSFMLRFSESLALENADCGVKVCAVSGLCLVGIPRRDRHPERDVRPARLGVVTGRRGRGIRNRCTGTRPGAGGAGLGLPIGQCRTAAAAACVCLTHDGARLASGTTAGLRQQQAVCVRYRLCAATLRGRLQPGRPEGVRCHASAYIERQIISERLAKRLRTARRARPVLGSGMYHASTAVLSATSAPT